VISFFSNCGDDVCHVAGNTLVTMVRRYPAADPHVRASLAQACLNPAFAIEHARRPGWDYAYDALWAATEVHVANRSRHEG